MTALDHIRDYLDALLHPSVRDDMLTSARHRAFIAPRLLGSLVALASLPIYLVIRSAPSEFEVALYAWLIAPILVSYFLSRTGRYESAHILSSLALAAMIMAVAINSGGIASFAAVWLVAVPLESALSASRRVVMIAIGLALGCVSILVGLEIFHALPASKIELTTAVGFEAFGIVSATLFAAALAFSMESVARAGRMRLSLEEDRYRLLALNMSDVISRHRGNGAVKFMSPAAESVFATPATRLLGHGLFDRVHVADRPAFLTALSNAARGGAHNVEFRVRRDATGGQAAHFIWIEMRCKPLDQVNGKNPSDTEVVAVMRDVTERKNQEEALEIARAGIERADASKTRFLATMSHELRTPLNAIIGFSEMIMQERELNVDAARRKEYATLINDSGLHLLSVVNGILDMSKMASGAFEIFPEPFQPREPLINCCNLLALKARESGIDLSARVADDLPLITGDPRAFRQIVLNLVSNALKFTERGGNVTVSAAIDTSHFVLRVADTGVGISPDDLKRLGDPFFQAGTTYRRRHEGTGLGLSIVKSLAELQGGAMNVESKLDVGTVVTVSLPVVAHKGEPKSNIARLDPASRVASTERMKKSA